MPWLTLRNGKVSHPIIGYRKSNPDALMSGCELVGYRSQGAQETHRPLRRPCKHPACQALLKTRPHCEGRGVEPHEGRGRNTTNCHCLKCGGRGVVGREE